MMAIKYIIKKLPTMMKDFAKYQHKANFEKEAKRIKVSTAKAVSNNDNKDEDKNKDI